MISSSRRRQRREAFVEHLDGGARVARSALRPNEREQLVADRIARRAVGRDGQAKSKRSHRRAERCIARRGAERVLRALAALCFGPWNTRLRDSRSYTGVASSRDRAESGCVPAARSSSQSRAGRSDSAARAYITAALSKKLLRSSARA